MNANLLNFFPAHRFLAARVTCIGLLLAISLFARSAAADDWLPGGKAYYVVSAASASQARLAYLVYFPGGRVWWSGWYWDKNITDARPGSSMAVGAGTWVGEDCDQTGQRRYSPNGELFNNGHDYQLGAEGELRTAYSFTGPPTEFKTGRFAPRDLGAVVRIDWDDGNWETWRLTAAHDGIQRLDLWTSSAALGYTKGIAAGSNSSFYVRVHPDNTVSNPVNKEYGFCTTATWVLNQSVYHKAPGDAGDEEIPISNCSCKPKRSYKTIGHGVSDLTIGGTLSIFGATVSRRGQSDRMASRASGTPVERTRFHCFRRLMIMDDSAATSAWSPSQEMSA